MTQRVALATVMDQLSIDAVITGYAVAVDDGSWQDYQDLFTPDGRADYRSAGGVEGPPPRSRTGSRRRCGSSPYAST